MSELWNLIWGKPEIDPGALSQAIEQELKAENPDFRTRLLIRDGARALEHYWGPERLKEWLDGSTLATKIEVIRNEDLGEPGFPSLKEQLMDAIKPETVKEFLRELGSRISGSATLEIGGAIAQIDKSALTKRLLSTTAAFMNEISMRQAAERNWYILFGENLPSL